MKKQIILFFVLLFGLFNCYESAQGANPPVEVSINKARYEPGDQVKLNIAPSALTGNVVVRYKYLSNVIAEHSVADACWMWTPPATDFRGYLVEIVDITNSEDEQVLGTVGIDVSSDWKKFPRYGFLTNYGKMTGAQQERVIANLNRYHINGLQYYDWLYKHHKPLAGTVAAPLNQWPDIFNRPTLKSTTLKYIQTAKKYNMSNMMYNLCFGAWENASADGVDETNWSLYNNSAHTDRDKHGIGEYGLSDIYVLDPGLPAWQTYLAQQNDDVYSVYDFDGFHVDQLGSGHDNKYNISGTQVSLPPRYLSFLNAMKAAHPEKRLLFNAVDNFGQSVVKDADIDFFYHEDWWCAYRDIVNYIKQNWGYKPLSTVFASYVNYGNPSGATYFNTPGVLFADAVIFAHGGAHLELGEHLLYSEYFPNNGLKMSEELEQSLLSYYQFLVGYQNLLRDGGAFNNPALTNTNSKITIAASSDLTQGKVAAVGKLVGNKQVYHLINFTNATTMDARDVNATQTVPTEITGIDLQLTVTGQVEKVWVASPDSKSGASVEIPFTAGSGNITFTVPFLKYWSMIVVEYK
jgi:dextranase